MCCVDEEAIDFEEEEEEEEEGEMLPVRASPPRKRSASRSPSPRGHRHRATRREGRRYSRSPSPRRRSATPPEQERDPLEDFLCDFADMTPEEREAVVQPLGTEDLPALEQLGSVMRRLPVKVTVMTIEKE